MKSFANHLEDIRSGGLPTVTAKAKHLIKAKFSSIYQPIYKRYMAKEIANSMINAVELKTQAYIVFDHSCSPLTYGDFFYVIMLARYFLVHNLKVVLLIIDGEYREDFRDENVFGCAQQFLSEQVEFANFISGNYKSNFQCKKINWQEAKNELLLMSNDNHTYIFQEKSVTRRLPIYINAFNTLSLLLSSLDGDLLKAFLLDLGELANWLNDVDTFPNQPYLALSARHNLEWRLESNTSPSLFVSIIKKLNANYPNMPIIVISNQLGCEYFKKVSEENNINCLFSKNLELPKSFISDILLVLGSRKYVQVNGGGLGAILIFSSVPYTIIAPTIHESIFANDKVIPWQTSDQIFKNLFYTDDSAKIFDDCI
jgi:hypothetical protein